MDGAYSTNGRREKYVHSFGRIIWREETAWKIGIGGRIILE